MKFQYVKNWSKVRRFRVNRGHAPDSGNSGSLVSFLVIEISGEDHRLFSLSIGVASHLCIIEIMYKRSRHFLGAVGMRQDLD